MPDLAQPGPQHEQAPPSLAPDVGGSEQAPGADFAPQATPEGPMAWGGVDGRGARLDRLREGPVQFRGDGPEDAEVPRLERRNAIRHLPVGQEQEAPAQDVAPALSAKAQTAEEVASLSGQEEALITFTVQFIETELTKPATGLKPFQSHGEEVKGKARNAALFTGRQAASREAKAQFGVLEAVSEMIQDAPTEVEATQKREKMFTPRFTAATELAPTNAVVEKASKEAIEDAIATHQAFENKNLQGVQIGGGDADLAAGKAGDASQVALSGKSEVDIRDPAGKKDNTGRDDDLGSKDLDVAGAHEDWDTLLAEKNAYGLIMKGWTVLSGSQDALAADAAKEAQEALTFGQTEGAAGKLKAGLGGFSFDSKTGTLSANLAKWSLVPPYPPLAKFATPISLAPGLGVTLEAVVTVSVGAKGNLTIKKEGYEDQLAQRAKAGSMEGAHKERQTQLETINAKVNDLNAALQAARDGENQADIEAATAAKEAGDAEKARIEEAIIQKAIEIRSMSDKLLKKGESEWSLKGDLGISANLGGEIFAGGFVGLPLVNVGAGIYAEMNTNMKAGMALTGKAKFPAGKNTPQWQGIKGDINAMARATAAIGAKVKYQFIFVSGDIYEVTFKDWTLGVIEYAGQMNTEPGLGFKTTKKAAHFGGLPPMEKELIQKGDEAAHYGDATGKKVGEMTEAAQGTKDATAAVGAKSTEVGAAKDGVSNAALLVTGAKHRKEQIGQESETAAKDKETATQKKNEAEEGQRSESAAAVSEGAKADRLDSVSAQTAGFDGGGMKDQAGQQAAYKATLDGMTPKTPGYMAPTKASKTKSKAKPKAPEGPSPKDKFKAAALTVGKQKEAVGDAFMHVVSKASAAGAQDAAAQAAAHESRAQGYQSQADALMQTILDKETAIEALRADAEAQEGEIQRAEEEVVAAKARLAEEATALDALIADLGTSMEETRTRSASLREKRIQSRTFTEKVWRNIKDVFGSDVKRSDLTQAMETAEGFEAVALEHKTKTDTTVAPKIQAVESKRTELAQQKQAAEAELARYEAGQDSKGATAIQNYKNHVQEIDEARAAILDLENKVQTVEGGAELGKAKDKVKELQANKPGKDGDMEGWRTQLQAATDEVTAIEASRKALIESLKTKIQAANVAKTRAKRARDSWRGGFFSRDKAIEGYRERISAIQELEARIEASGVELSSLKLVQVEADEMLAEARALVAKAQGYIDEADSADGVVRDADAERRRAMAVSEAAHGVV